jgi:tRNA(fMet)-specific endonuclease VapC
MTGNSIALDSNQAIACLNGRPGFDSWMAQFTSIHLPVIVVGELRFGALKSARSSANITRIQSLVSRCEILNVNARTAEIYAQLRLGLMRKGAPIPENDLWIGAICVENNVPLASADAHFSAIEGLKLVTTPTPR